MRTDEHPTTTTHDDPERLVQERSRPRPAPEGVPSGVSQARLANEVKREVAELRVRMSEASLRSGALRDAGHPQAAAAVVAEQRAMLDDFHSRLDAVVSGAAVEREAERVLAAELVRPDGHAEPRRLPAALSAALAAAALVALSLGPSDGITPAPAASAGLDAAAPSGETGGPARTQVGAPDDADEPDVARQPEEQASFSAVERAAAPPPSSSPEDADAPSIDPLLRVIEVELGRGAELAHAAVVELDEDTDTIEAAVVPTAQETDEDPEADDPEGDDPEGDDPEGDDPEGEDPDHDAREQPGLGSGDLGSGADASGEGSAEDGHDPLAPNAAGSDIG